MAYTSPSITPSGTTFTQFQAGGTGGILERLIAENLPGTAVPGAPTVNATGGGGTGGNLAAGTYYIVVTETNGIGETTASPELSVAIVAGDIPQVTFAALQAGNTARNVYVGTSSGGEVLYATGVTSATFNLAATIPSDSYAVPVPAVNTTGLTSANPATGVVANQKLSALRSCENGRLQQVWDDLARTIAQFNQGQPMSFSATVTKLRDAHTVFAALSELCAEAGNLIDANPGHFTTVCTGIGGRQTIRQWP
jgi:hypothetical protein